MNPYLATAIAMCVIVALSLAGTAYLAMMFNRRAKADLSARLTPLAEAIGGTIDLDDAVVEGRYAGHLVFGRVANAPGGIGRLFLVEVVDSAGGEGWEWSSLPVKGAPTPERTFDGGAALEQRLGIDWNRFVMVVPNAESQRFGVAYDPAAGTLKLPRAMRSRNDIPDRTSFLAQLDALVSVGLLNRRAQGAPTSEPVPMSSSRPLDTDPPASDA